MRLLLGGNRYTVTIILILPRRHRLEPAVRRRNTWIRIHSRNGIAACCSTCSGNPLLHSGRALGGGMARLHARADAKDDEIEAKT